MPWLSSLIRACASGCRWEAGNTNEWSALTYPDEVLPFVVAEFKRMKERQAQLLGFNNRFQTIQSKL
jgi:hypothetical protein